MLSLVVRTINNSPHILFFSRKPSGHGARGVPNAIKERDLLRVGWQMVEVPFDLHDHRPGHNAQLQVQKDFQEVMNLVLTGSYNSPNYAKYAMGDSGRVRRDDVEDRD